MKAEALHDALLTLSYPTSLALSPDGSRLAYIPTYGDPRVRLLAVGPTAAQGPAVEWRTEHRPALVCWSTTGTHAWLVAQAPDAQDRLELRDATGALVAAAAVAGAVEDVVATGPASALVRVAAPGADRDGMNLGLRVAGEPDDPAVARSWARPGRRLVLASLDTGTDGDGARLRLESVDLGPWSVWEATTRSGRVAAVVSTDPLPSGFYRPTLVVADLAGTTPLTRLLDTDAQLARPRLSPDGTRLLVLRGRSIVSGTVLLFDLDTGAHTQIPDLDDVTDIGWLDEDTAWFAGWADTGVQIGRISGLTGPSPQVSRWTANATIPGEGAQPSLAVHGDQAYAAWEAPGEPPEVVCLGLDAPGHTALTHDNTALQWLGDDIVHEQVAWRSDDDTEVHGMLLTSSAPGAEPRAPLPLVVLLHGGPTWLWSSAFAPAESNHLALPLVASGAAVFLPNPRGSSGRGQAFAALVAGDVGGGDLADVLSGIAHLVALGLADPDRVAVMGLSYGGYLSALASLRSPGFRAAVVMSGVSDWISFGSTSAIGGGYTRTYLPDGDVGTPAGLLDLAGRSPIYQAPAVPVPTLILHGREDRITPLGQAEQLHRVLTRGGGAVSLVTYPREGHELVEPGHRRDAAARVLDWLRTHGVLARTEG
jgi:dipeptidyl aminopeptidase/acylaminoacyl peptidase